ncbi:MAG: dual specificity protein phosphatase family protein [Promethearchaeota archaeon]
MAINQIIRWIIPGKLAGSPFPLFKELGILPQLNLMLVVNLTSRGLPNSLKEQLKTSGVKFKRLSIPDFGIPTEDTINHYLQIVCETLQNEQAVLTHCIAGCGRTGTMIGLFLVTHGYKSTEALEIIHGALGEGCPETENQLALLHQYRGKCPNSSRCKGLI